MSGAFPGYGAFTCHGAFGAADAPARGHQKGRASMTRMVAMLVILGALANTTRAQPALTVKDYDDFYSNVILEAKNGSKT